MTTALLVIDIQNDYFPNGMMSLTNPEQAAQNTAKLLTHFRQTGSPIFHVQHITEGEIVLHEILQEQDINELIVC